MESEATHVLTDQEAQMLSHVLDNIKGGILRVSFTVSSCRKVRMHQGDKCNPSILLLNALSILLWTLSDVFLAFGFENLSFLSRTDVQAAFVERCYRVSPNTRYTAVADL